MSFANQALGLEWLRAQVDELEPRVYDVPEEIDREVARLKLESMGIHIDSLTEEQRAYAESYDSGT
jgi:adenosylhomocysteinase